MNFGTLGTGFGGMGRGGAGVAYEAEAVTLFAAMLAAGSEPDATRKGHINTLIAALKTAGIWSELDLFYILAAHSAAAAVINWKTPGTFDCVAVNSPTFATDQGYTGDGSTSRLRTQYTPSTHAVKFQQDNASAWVWCRNDVSAGARDLGSGGTGSVQIVSRNGTNLQFAINDLTLSAAAGPGTSVGLSGTSRASSGTKKAWKNGTQLGADASVASTGLPNQEQWICGLNATSFSTRQIAFAAWGSALTGKELALYNAVSAYMTSIGA